MKTEMLRVPVRAARFLSLLFLSVLTAAGAMAAAGRSETAAAPRLFTLETNALPPSDSLVLEAAEEFFLQVEPAIVAANPAALTIDLPGHPALQAVRTHFAGNGYRITANTRYVVTVTTRTRQSKTDCGLSTPISNGPLTAHGGRWMEGDDIFPRNGSCSNFWTDISFDK